MIVLKKANLVVIVLTAYVFCSFIVETHFLIAEELKEEKALELQGPKEEKLIGKDAIVESVSVFVPEKRIRLEAAKPIPKAEESVLMAPKLIELEAIGYGHIEAMKVIGFETTGCRGEPIIFSYGDIPKLMKSEKDIYSVGDHVTSLGMAEYDADIKLGYIDIIKIDREELSANTYMRLYFKKEPSSVSLGSYYEIKGIVGKIFSPDRIYLDEVDDLRQIFVDKNRVIETCALSVKDNLNIIISEPVKNERLRSWMSKEYGISGLSEDQLLKTLSNVKSIRVDYDFFDKIAKCAFWGDAIKTGEDFGISLKLECLYNSDSDTVEKTHISLNKVAFGRIN